MSTNGHGDRGWRIRDTLRLLALTAAFAFVCAMPQSLQMLLRFLGF